MGFPGIDNGGVSPSATNYFLFLPVRDLRNGVVYIGVFDMTNFDDPVDGSSYTYRSEDIAIGRVPTVRRVILVYRDLGTASLTVAVSGSNDLKQVISASTVVQLGNAIPTFQLLTSLIDLSLTAFRPQLSFRRAPGSGPVSISSATMVGEIEEVTL